MLFQAMSNQGVQGNQKMYSHQLPTGSASNPDSAQRDQPGRRMQPKHFCQHDMGWLLLLQNNSWGAGELEHPASAAAFEYFVRQMGKPGGISLFQKVFKGNKNSHRELAIWSNQKSLVKTEGREKHSGGVYMFFPSFAGFNITEVGNCEEDSHSSSLVFKISGAGGHQSVVRAVSHRDICRVLSPTPPSTGPFIDLYTSLTKQLSSSNPGAKQALL